MDKERLRHVLRELKERHEEEWNSHKEQVLSSLKRISEILLKERLTFEDIEQIRTIRDSIPEKFKWFNIWFPRDKSECINLYNNKKIKKLLKISSETDNSNFETKLGEIVNVINEIINDRSITNVGIATLSSFIAVVNPTMFMPIAYNVINKQFRIDFSVKVFWGSRSNPEKYLEFMKTIKEIASSLRIDSILEVAFYISKYKGENRNNDDINDLKEKINNLLNTKNQIILYGPPGTGKTWITRRYVEAEADDFDFVTFHPTYAYEEFVEGLRPCTENGQIAYKVEEGVFKRICREAFNELLAQAEIDKRWEEGENVPELTESERDKVKELLKSGNYPKFYLIIDEINRGDISRIFGELITLLEADKRLFAENEITVTLPYSKTKFGVPPNLYIIGTMNTADRSIALIDIALRRRFGFIELMPSYKVLINELGIDSVETEKQAVDKIKNWNENDLNDVKKLAVRVLYSINERIRNLYDRDHQIGHSYFLKLKDCENIIETLKNIWYHEIIPLLQEYFYDSPKKLKEVLGDKFVIVDKNETTYEFKQMEEFDDDNKFIEALKSLIPRGEQGG